MPVIAVYGAVLGVMLFVLSVRTLRLRRTLSIGIGDGGNVQMLRAMRAHANFAEYVPICLLLAYFAEIAGAHAVLTHGLGGTLLLGRIAHAYGVSQPREDYRFRVFGMAMTFSCLMCAAIFLLWRYVS